MMCAISAAFGKNARKNNGPFEGFLFLSSAHLSFQFFLKHFSAIMHYIQYYYLINIHRHCCKQSSMVSEIAQKVCDDVNCQII